MNKSFAAMSNKASLDLSALSGLELEAFYLGLNATVWGYPVVKFEQLMRGRTLVDAALTNGNPRAQVNGMALVRHLRGPEYRQIATPNNDTLYAQSFIDVSREPIVVSVPEVDVDRYYTMQFWDPHGDTFAYIGSRTTGSKAGDYALVGPDWGGQLPDHITAITCEYNNLALWGRIGVQGPNDVKSANAIQDQLHLTPLSQFDQFKRSGCIAPVDEQFSSQRVRCNMPDDLDDGLEYYYQLARALKYTPPKACDAVVVASLEQIGFEDNNHVFAYKTLSEAQKSGLIKAYQFAQKLMDASASTAGESVNGWRWSRKSGIMGTDYVFRAAWAKWYTGGATADEAIYMDGRRDDLKELFNGSNQYHMHFSKDQLPRVRAFWSISLYDSETGAFVENSIKRYSIGDRTVGLTYNDDGSLDIYLQQNEPDEAALAANWLPTPTRGFYLNFRLFNPDDSLQNGTWQPPLVQRIGS